jgi:malate dehydrogenase (oxaloacetate-decarboxylating)(NADP+)
MPSRAPAHAGRGDRGRRPVPRALGPRVLTPEMVAKMAERPIIFALANPTPEILPDAVRARSRPTRSSPRAAAISRTRSTTCCAFRSSSAARWMSARPRSTTRCRSPASRGSRRWPAPPPAPRPPPPTKGEQLTFGADYLIPKPFDPRLMGVVHCRGAQAAMASGVATRPDRRSRGLQGEADQSVFRSALIMRPVFEAAATASRRIVFAEGEDERVLRAARRCSRKRPTRPILIGRPEVIERRANGGADDPSPGGFRDS